MRDLTVDRCCEQHVAVQFDGADEKHWVNGLFAESTPCPGDPSQGLVINKEPQSHLRIGARGGYDCAENDPDNCQPSVPGSQFRVRRWRYFLDCRALRLANLESIAVVVCRATLTR